MLHLSKQIRNTFLNLCKFYVNQAFFPRSDCVDSICFANTAVGPGLPVTHERFVRTPQLDRSPQKEDGGLCLLERKSGVDKRMPGAAVFVSRSHALRSTTNKGNCVLKGQSLVPQPAPNT